MKKQRMFQSKVKVLFNKRVKESFFHCSLSASSIAKEAMPGKFINVKVADGSEPLLRRPFSIHRISKDKVEILYEAVGPGTKILSQRKPGEYLDVIGPLGNGFDLKSCSNELAIIVAGGMGVAPLAFLAEKLAGFKNRGAKCKIIIGAKSKNHVLCEKEFKDLDYDVTIATDDGSRGFKGRVTDLLVRILRENGKAGKQETIYACGPRPMLKEISRISRAHKIRAQISLEEHMACGIGACLGCVVNTVDGYKRVCKEGPVFGADEIIW